MQPTNYTRTARSTHAADLRADRLPAADYTGHAATDRTLVVLDRQWAEAMAAVRASDARAEALRAAYAARRTPPAPRGIWSRLVALAVR